ncbi:PREDICTED: eukaryotic translation initiation factor 3 subunit M [Populus euphratica]|uniref:Eukaryotic translation initiation factor 3 subunit M n=1 Tax=Populus euphratica TaxID=75702 RepID=A0AAJ6TDK9_POPEU|nr:PREDICTED: eukaryotic translation initiation factor 3 subunit M [Populus euphratica]
MTTIVPTSEEDPALSVVRFTSELSWSDAGPAVAEQQVSRLCVEAQECMVMNRWLDLTSLMLTSADIVFSNSKVSEKDLECIFTVICNLVTKSGIPDEELEMAKLICAKIIQQPTDKPVLRLKILFNLYNLLDNVYCRFYVYMKALNLAMSGKVTEHIIPSCKKIDSFLKEWNLEVQDQRELFLCVANALKDSKSSAKDSFKFLTRYLATFSGEDAYKMGEAKDEAARTIIEFVKAPDMFQCDLLDMPAVAQLEKDAKYALVYQLLKIFLTQRLDAYLEFQAVNSALLKSYGLVHEDCITKMRLISLVDLASHESGRIPYTLIKDTLRINDDEVESWVVRALTSKLIACKMDQMNQVVLVSSCTERVFGRQQWQVLRTKLGTWRDNIANVINTIQANKITEDSSQAVQGLMIR